jgi:hypothetical protein
MPRFAKRPRAWRFCERAWRSPASKRRRNARISHLQGLPRSAGAGGANRAVPRAPASSGLQASCCGAARMRLSVHDGARRCEQRMQRRRLDLTQAASRKVTSGGVRRCRMSKYSSTAIPLRSQGSVPRMRSHSSPQRFLLAPTIEAARTTRPLERSCCLNLAKPSKFPGRQAAPFFSSRLI